MESVNSTIQKNRLKNRLALNVIIFIVLISLWIFVISPKFTQIWEKKDILTQNIWTYKSYNEKWISLDEYKNITKEVYIQKLLESDPDFYNRTLATKPSNEFNNYEDFLKKKTEEVNEFNKEGVRELRENKLSIALPIYGTQPIDDIFSEDDVETINNNYSDLDFVNYVERLLKTFELKTDSPIVVWQIKPIDDDSWENIKDQLFYMPLELSITWRKSDVVEFIYFIEKVWNVSIVDDDLEFYKDNIIKFTWTRKSEITENRAWNIYENQLMDIDSIVLGDYIDTSDKVRKESELDVIGFLDTIVSWAERRDEYTIYINLRFYVRWLPTYRVETDAEKVLTNFQALKQNINKYYDALNNTPNLQITWNKKEYMAILKRLKWFIVENETTVQRITGLINAKSDYTWLYNIASSLNNDLSNLKDYIDPISKDIENAFKVNN